MSTEMETPTPASSRDITSEAEYYIRIRFDPKLELSGDEKRIVYILCDMFYMTYASTEGIEHREGAWYVDYPLVDKCRIAWRYVAGSERVWMVIE